MSSDASRRRPVAPRRDLLSRQTAPPSSRQPSPPRLPHTVLKGISHVVALPAAAPPPTGARTQYDSNSSAACVRWLRSVARTLGSCYLEPTDSSDDPNAGRAAPGAPGDHAAGHRQFRADNAAAATYAPMAMRAGLVRSHIGFAVSQGTLVPKAAEEEESDGDGDDDGDEPAVEPLRQSGVQAVVRGTVRRRRAGEALQKYEQVLTNRDLWVPTSLTHQYRRREIQELQMLQPWGAMLPSDLRDRSGGPPPEEIRQRYVHLGHYVPRIEDMRRLIAIQNGHTQRLIEIVGNAAAIKLGLRDLAPRHAAELWNQKYPDAAAPLCAALAGKEDGLEQLRRDKFAGVRMYDLAEYYYKVWRTLHTEQAQAHYQNKCMERKKEALRDQRQQPRAPKALPVPPVRVAPRPPPTDRNGEAAGNGGSARSSPRAGSASGGAPRNVRPRTEAAAPARSTGGLPSLHSGHSTAQTYQAVPGAAPQGAAPAGPVAAAASAAAASAHIAANSLNSGSESPLSEQMW